MGYFCFYFRVMDVFESLYLFEVKLEMFFCHYGKIIAVPPV